MRRRCHVIPINQSNQSNRTHIVNNQRQTLIYLTAAHILPCKKGGTPDSDGRKGTTNQLNEKSCTLIAVFTVCIDIFVHDTIQTLYMKTQRY